MDRKKFFKRGLRQFKKRPYLKAVVEGWLDNDKDEVCPVATFIKLFPDLYSIQRFSPYVKGQVRKLEKKVETEFDRSICYPICFRFFPPEESIELGHFLCPCVVHTVGEVRGLLRELLRRAEEKKE